MEQVKEDLVLEILKNYCSFCGSELNESQECPYAIYHAPKKMCLNCCHLSYDPIRTVLICNNEESLEEAKLSLNIESINIKKGYEIAPQSIQIIPTALKKPSGACSKWCLK